MTELFNSVAQESEKHGEHNDCAVRALSITTDYEYDDVRYILSALGRKNRKGTPFFLTRRAAELLRHELVDVTDKFSSRTIRTLQREMQGVKGRYLVRVRRHVLAIVDGKVHDWTEGRCHRIIGIFKVQEIDKEWHRKNS